MSRSAYGRRRFLYGLGGVTIGLPVAASIPNLVRAAPGQAPPRYVSLYFGNGLPRLFADNGYRGPLGPLSPFQSKLAMVTGLNMNEANSSSIHWTGTSRFGVGHRMAGQTVGAGGESLDNALHRKFAPPGSILLPVNLTREADNLGGDPRTRHYHSWKRAGTWNREVQNPRDVWNVVFSDCMGQSGDPMNGSGTAPDPEAVRRSRYRHSVLDAVKGQYEEIVSSRSGYSAGIRGLVSDHLELVRELEKKVADMTARLESGGSETPMGSGTCEGAPSPALNIVPEQACTPSLCSTDQSQYIRANTDANWNEVWRLNAELYAMALRMGRVHYGTLGCTGGGDRYAIPELGSRGVNKSPHEYAHDFRADWNNDNAQKFALCVEWIMEKIAYFLQLLDDSAWPDPNGGTVLDNTLVMIGTEMGTPGNGQHNGDYMTFFLAGGGGRIQSGVHRFAGNTDTEFYNAVARAMNLGETFGDSREFTDSGRQGDALFGIVR